MIYVLVTKLEIEFIYLQLSMISSDLGYKKEKKHLKHSLYRGQGEEEEETTTTKTLGRKRFPGADEGSVA